jgi:PQQ-dependent dehydrogenase (methanol/ethanol family)
MADRAVNKDRLLGRRLGCVSGRLAAIALGATSLAIAGCGKSGPAAVDGKAIVKAAPGEWLSYGRTYDEQRFSPLTSINKDTASRLGLAWETTFDTDRGQEATPVVSGGVLYVTTAWSKVFAFDAKTGAKLWSYDPEVAGVRAFSACCDVVNRGVALWKGKVYVGALDGRLIALDAKTGVEEWSVVTVDQSKPYTITGAPRVVKGMVLIGNGGAEYGVRGYLTAYDAETGAKKWRFYTTPNPEGKPDGEASDSILAEKAAPTWSDGAWKQSGGGGTVWDAMAYDPKLDLLYFGVGNGSPWNHRVRSGGKGDNLFISSIVAVDPDTGKYAWHYQTTPAETWDYTATQHIILADLALDGKKRRVLMQAPKNGFFYVLDRKTGEVLRAVPYIPMGPEDPNAPPGTPISWSIGKLDENHRPIENPSARYADRPALIAPAPFGGHNWQPMAFNPQTGLVYIPVNTLGALSQVYGDDPAFKYREGAWNTGISMQLNDLPSDEAVLKAIKAMMGAQLVAFDPVKGEARWAATHPTFWNAGVLATAGGLVFQGSGEGRFSAYDAESGKIVWSQDIGNGIIAAPMTYAIDGEQYVAILSGFGGVGPLAAGLVAADLSRQPGKLSVFKLDGAGSPAPRPAIIRAPIDVATVSAPGNVDRGRAVYNENCLVCHSANASGGFLPDLKRSAAIRDVEAFKSIVIDGGMAQNGMASFAKFLSPDDAEDVRAFLVTEAKRAALLHAQQAPPQPQ